MKYMIESVLFDWVSVRNVQIRTLESKHEASMTGHSKTQPNLGIFWSLNTQKKREKEKEKEDSN